MIVIHLLKGTKVRQMAVRMCRSKLKYPSRFHGSLLGQFTFTTNVCRALVFRRICTDFNSISFFIPFRFSLWAVKLKD